MSEQNKEVGVTSYMPGTDGFTMACFHAKDVPVGTKLYVASKSPAPIPEQVAHASGIEWLTRYDLMAGDMIEKSLGDYVRYADVERLLATQSAKQGSQEDGPTYMDDKQASDWAWAEVKREVGAGGWTCGEYGNYYGFFLWGWRYGKQFVKQGTTAGDPTPAAPLQTMDDTTRDEALEEVKEGGEILESFINNVSTDGPYSAEATLTFISQAKQCVDGAIRALMKSASPVSGEAGEKGGKS